MTTLRKSDPRTSVVLFSGGMDSTVSLFVRLQNAQRAGGVVHALTFAYGQKHRSETRYAGVIWNNAKQMYGEVMGEHIIHPISMMRGIESSLLLRTIGVAKYKDMHELFAYEEQDPAFIPYRNLIFLSFAAQYAFAKNAGVISTGLRGGYADCTAEFETIFGALLKYVLPDYHISIETPTHMSRADTLRLADVTPGCWEALATSLTCFDGTTPPCGHCLPCMKRAAGFAEVGAKDPIFSRLYGPKGELLGPTSRPVEGD